MQLTSSLQKAFRVCLLMWFVGWSIKLPYFLQLFEAGLSLPLSHPLFPATFERVETAIIFYFLPYFICPLAFFASTRRASFIAALLLFGAAISCTLHLAFYNDATFITSTWVAAWLMWFMWSYNSPIERFKSRAQWMAKGVVAVFFLGGTIGKLTPSYWSGEVIHEIYFLNKTYLPYEILRASLSEETLRLVSTIFSRMTIIMEALLVVGILAPFRYYAPFVTTMLVMMVLFSAPQLLSVMAAPMGMMIAMLIWISAQKSPQERLLID